MIPVQENPATKVHRKCVLHLEFHPYLFLMPSKEPARTFSIPFSPCQQDGKSCSTQPAIRTECISDCVSVSFWAALSRLQRCGHQAIAGDSGHQLTPCPLPHSFMHTVMTFSQNVDRHERPLFHISQPLGLGHPLNSLHNVVERNSSATLSQASILIA
jgi:hypothetical protein